MLLTLCRPPTTTTTTAPSPAPSFDAAGAFGRRAVEAIAAVVLAAGEDVARVAFWWANAAALRSFLHVSIASGHAPAVLQEAVDGLVRVERAIFERLLQIIWWQTLVPRMQLARCAHVKVDDAADYWFDAVQAVHQAFCPARAQGDYCACLPHLCQEVVAECLCRLDVALLNCLLRAPLPDPSKHNAPRPHFNPLFNAHVPEDPVADPLSNDAMTHLLPGAGHKRSFGSGMKLKMFVGDLNDLVETLYCEWAAAGKRQARPLQRPFPQLRASADVLMMPKACLADPVVRGEVCVTAEQHKINKLYTT
jgi:hypothetical protein